MQEFEVFTCCLPLSNESIILGTSYGKVYMGRLKTLSEIEALDFTNIDHVNVLEEISTEIFNLGGTIRAIERLDSENIIILSSYGDIICFHLNDNSRTQIQEGNSSKYNKTWRLLVIDENRFLTIGNYKKLNHWLKVDENFKSHIEPEFQEFNETHAYFCMDWIEENNTFIINNFESHTELWETTASGISRISSFQMERNLQRSLVIESNYLITVDYYGFVYVSRIENNVFQKAFEFRISSNQGNTVYFSSEMDSILIGTNSELIFLEKDFQNVYIKSIPVKQIFSFNNIELILTDKAIARLNYESKEIPQNIINYRYKKVGLVGDHDVGKTTFCRFLKYGHLTDEQMVSEESSLGRHVWTLNIEDEDEMFFQDNIKKIMYFDIAGQKSEHFTYFPILYDSDIILLFYQGTDRNTFDQVVEYYLELRERCAKSKFYFIQTHSEQHQRPRNRYLERELNKVGLDMNTNLIKIDSKSGMGYDDFDEKVLQNLDWDSAPTVIEMPVFGTLMEYFDQIYNTGSPTSISLDELSQLVLNLDEIRLENIILSFYHRGIIQYLEEEKMILINNEDYEIMHSEIANLIDEEDGYVKSHLIYQELGGHINEISYIKNILKYFKDNEIGIVFKENNSYKETYIFFRKIKDNIEVPSEYETHIPKNLTNFGYSNIILQLEIFLEFLNSYPLELISISKSKILVKMDHGPDNTLLFLKINSGSEDDTVNLCSFGINKTEDIDYKLEKDLTSFILDNLGENLKDISMESDHPLFHDLSIQEQIKYLLKTPSEHPYLDFKTKYKLGTKAEKAEFLKDTIALTNSAIFSENLAFLFIGFEEKHGKILKLHNVDNFKDLEPQSAPILNIYLNNYPELEFHTFKINELFNWQRNGEISSKIPFTNDQKNPANEDFILVIKYIRKEQKVCDIKAIINFEKNGKPKEYNRGMSWWRINSYSFFISEIEKEILRKK